MNPNLPGDPQRWRKIEAILDEVLELSPEDRGSYLDQACAGDPELRGEVEALLAADAAADDFLGTPAREVAASLFKEPPPRESARAHLEGRELGPYRLIREIGSGGMGVVYEAEDKRLHRRVAVKLLPPELSQDQGAKERFLREARAASALDHPNLCTVHDVGDCDGQLYIVMAYYEGETLKERLERGPLAIEEARQMAIQVARGLMRAHETGIIHRDIKPANVMLTRRGEAKILDFGIAKTRSDTSLTRTGIPLGTPAYMSPEQAQGKRLDARADLWSLGAMLYEALAGRRPFGGEDEQAVLHAILSQEPEPLDRVCPDVPPALAGAVSKALARNPDQRYQSAAELLADLESGTAPRKKLGFLSARWVWGLLGAAVALSLALWWYFRAPTIRVAVLSPVVTKSEENPDFAFASSQVVQAAFATLASLKGIEPLDPPARDEKSNSPEDRLRLAEADEGLQIHLNCRAETCRVSLHRLSASDRVVLETLGSFDVRTGIEEAYGLEEAVRGHLQQLFPRYHPQREALSREVRPQDYAAFVELERRVNSGERLGTEELDRLDSLLGTSPDLLGANLLAAGIARGVPDLDRAKGYAQDARQLAPHDPRPLFELFRIEIADDRLNDAQATLDQFKEIAPYDIRVQIAKAELLEARDELKEARTLREEIVRRRPAWRNILGLAVLEVKLGAGETTRHRLINLLKDQPNNYYLLEPLAALEMLYGDPNEAMKLCQRLIEIRPTSLGFSSLGFARYLLKDYGAAVEAYRRAIDLEPGDLFARFNLATAEEARGHRAEARELYLSLMEEFETASGQPDTHTRMLYVQCLARLGDHEEADRLAEELLDKMPENVQVLHQAAQVYALLNKPNSAVFYTERALKIGLSREWFTVPGFSSLATDPEFQKLLAPHPAHSLNRVEVRRRP